MTTMVQISRDRLTWNRGLPITAHFLFLYSSSAKNHFHIFKWLKNNQKMNIL
jgi:hypothetical protein